MFLIERLWIDTMENQNAYGFRAIGVVASKEEADRICGLENVLKSQHPWPLRYADEFVGDSVPLFRAKKLTDLGGLTLEQLKEV